MNQKKQPLESNQRLLMTHIHKQGCVLAPTLFNLFINDLASYLLGMDAHRPKLGYLSIPPLLHADDVVRFSHMKLGLKPLESRAAAGMSP